MLVSLQANTPAMTNAGSYARIVADHAQRRRLIEAGQALERLGYESRADVDVADEARRLVADATSASSPASSPLVFLSAAELVAEVDVLPPVGHLARPVWPGDAYGVLAAEHKAGKTWAIADLAVAVAAGKAWLGVFPIERPGRVLVFLGEGGKRKMTRRFRAVAGFYGVRFEDLPIDVCMRVPHLTSDVHLGLIAANLAANPETVLVIIDPLYLAARGAKGSDLYAMGEHLERLQGITQEIDAALVVAHHWNQTGNGKGAERMSGAGPAEWGRFLGSAAVVTRHTDLSTKATAVTLDWSFVGDEIPDLDVRIRRRVWADDPDDLNSPMHYEVEQIHTAEPDDTLIDLRPAHRRVLNVLRADDWLNAKEIGDHVAVDSTGLGGLKTRTIQDACKTLVETNHAQADGKTGTTHKWRAHPDPDETENAD